MKKFFEAPEASSVELGTTDVIMASQQLAGDNGITVLESFADVMSDEYNMWKGFGE